LQIACLCLDGSYNSAVERDALRVESDEVVVGPEKGRAFFFLPLPIAAGGFPVHMNAYFELSSNRREQRMGGATGDAATGDGLVRAAWNTALLEDLIAPSLGRGILDAASLLTVAAHHIQGT
jgi:sacsin